MLLPGRFPSSVQQGAYTEDTVSPTEHQPLHSSFAHIWLHCFLFTALKNLASQRASISLAVPVTPSAPHLLRLGRILDQLIFLLSFFFQISSISNVPWNMTLWMILKRRCWTTGRKDLISFWSVQLWLLPDQPRLSVQEPSLFNFSHPQPC